MTPTSQEFDEKAEKMSELDRYNLILKKNAKSLLMKKVNAVQSFIQSATFLSLKKPKKKSHMRKAFTAIMKRKPKLDLGKIGEPEKDDENF
jgi:hypothetical protein